MGKPKRTVAAMGAVRCIAVAVADGVPMVVVAVDLARLLGGAAAVAAVVVERWGTPSLPIDADGALWFEIGTESVRVSAERLAISNRLTPSLLVVSPADAGAVPHLVRTVDLRAEVP